MSNRLVSIVLCTYNGNRFVGEQLESIIGQTYRNLEIIIVDDASTDDTFATLSSFAEKDKRIILQRNEQNMGYNLNFNKACRLSTGDFIAIADQDDIWQSTKIETLLAALEANPNTLLVHCISARFEKFGKFHLKSPKLVNYHAGKDVRNFFLSNFISGHNMLLKRELLNKALPFPAEVYYDWWLAAVASCNGRVEAVPQILVWHRMHESNATGAAKPKIKLYKQVSIILPRLMTIPGMKESDRNFGAQLLKYYLAFPAKKFSMPLFMFLLKHARILFAHKKRRLPWISYFKHAMKAAKLSTDA